MPILVRCVQCSGQLRVADELIGKRVRCPACGSIFTATAPAEAPPAAPPPKPAPEPPKPVPVDFSLDDVPVVTEKVDPWKSLDLELTEQPPPPPAKKDDDEIVMAEVTDPPPGDGLYGAVEVGGTPSTPSTPSKPTPRGPDEVDDLEPVRRKPADPDEDDLPLRRKVPERAVPPSEGGGRGRRRPERDDEDEDTVRCPDCDRRVGRDRKRCSFCDARLDRRGRGDDDDDDRDDDRRDRRRGRRSRRDGEGHRGGLVLTLGIVSLVVPFVCWCGMFVAPVAGFVGAILGVVAWVMGASDLRKMRDGVMDDEGEGSTRGGYVCAILGVIFNVILVIGCGAWSIYAINEAAKVQDEFNGNVRQKNGGGFRPPR